MMIASETIIFYCHLSGFYTLIDERGPLIKWNHLISGSTLSEVGYDTRSLRLFSGSERKPGVLPWDVDRLGGEEVLSQKVSHTVKVS